MNSPLHAWLPSGFFLVALLSLVVTLALSIAHLDRVSELARQQVALDRAKATLDQLADAVTNAELGQRGYLLTGDRTGHVDDYRLAVHDSRRLLDEVKQAIGDELPTPDTGERLAQLERAITAKIADMDHLIDVFDSRGGEVALDLLESGQGLELTRELQAARGTVRRYIQHHIRALSSVSRQARAAARISAILSTFLSLVFLAMAAIGTQQQHASRLAANAQARLHAQRLTALADLGIRFGAAGSAERLLDLIANEARTMFQAELAAVVVRGDARSRAVVSTSTSAAALSSWDPLDQPLEVGLDAEASGGVALVGHEDDAMPGMLHELGDVRYAVAVPLLARNAQALGHLVIAQPRNGPFGAHDIVAIAHLGQLAGAAHERATLVHDLQRTADEREHFLGLLGHELRNPLAAVSAASSVLEKTGADEPVVATLRRQTSLMGRIIDDLLDLERLDHGKLAIAKARLDVAQATREVVSDLMAARDLDQEAIQVDAPGPAWVHADQARLQQCVSNLVDNALKYAEGSRVHISVWEDHEARQVCIAVTDGGVGLEAGAAEALFERFAQVLPRAGGLGLGLALVRRLVELHQGTIEVSSPGPGHGATFTIRMPQAA